MGLLGKMKKNGNQEVAAQPEASVSFPVTEVAQAKESPADLSPIESTEGGVVEGNDDEAPETPTIAQEIEAPPSPSDEGPDSDAAPEGEGEEDDGGEDLMDIFTSEEEEDVDLFALTDSLVTIEAGDLLGEAQDISARLKEHLAK